MLPLFLRCVFYPFDIQSFIDALLKTAFLASQIGTFGLPNRPFCKPKPIFSRNRLIQINRFDVRQERVRLLVIQVKIFVVSAHNAYLCSAFKEIKIV